MSRAHTCRGTPHRGRTQGFSLIELLIVVAIILIIAAIAIPNLLRAKIASNEASAADSVRTIASGQIAYSATYPTVGYAPNIASLGGPAAGCNPSAATACLIDAVLSGGSKSGYQLFSAGFNNGGGPNTAFVASSAPVTFDVSGVRDFCIATEGVLRVNPGGAGVVPAPDVPTCEAYQAAQ